MIDHASVIAALDTVIDPKTGKGLVQANLVQGLVVEKGRAGFVMEVAAKETALYAPVRDQAEAALRGLNGMERVSVVLTAEAVATPARRTASLTTRMARSSRTRLTA